MARERPAPRTPGPADHQLARAALSATWRATRSPWVWTPAAAGTVGMATATLALARLLTVPPRMLRGDPPWTLRARAVPAGSVTLTGPGADVPGRWGLEYPGGAGEVGPAVAGPGGTVQRPFRLLSGDLPDGLQPARLQSYVWPDRRSFARDTGIDGADLHVAGETGPLPGWVFPAGDRRRWCVLVHGRGAPRAQMLRLVPTLHAEGITALVISYRNDATECEDPSGRMHFGHREWLDLEAAVAAAQGAGAEEIVLAGMSMGGAIIKSFLHRSALAERVIASVLDAPALNWGPILRHVARSRGLPSWLVPGIMTAVAWQTRIDWDELNHAGCAGELTRPVLLVHGDADPVVPVALSDGYAEAAPDLVRYLRVEGAGHVSAWNTAPEEYEQALGGFLQSLGTGVAADLRGVA
jgi:uncharacterized protein